MSSTTVAKNGFAVKSTEHPHLWKVQSETDPSKVYSVYTNGQLKCSCKGFLTHRHCKHADAVAVALQEQHEDVQAEQLTSPPHAAVQTPASPQIKTSPTALADGLKPWIVEIHGQMFVKFAGLLQLAHTQGLKSLSVKLIQVSPQLAVAEATVEMEDGRSFSEIGDASPGNVNKTVAQHFIRCAATRAKARALRDALNIGLCSLEEIE